MSIVVEDGTALSNAESYSGVATAIARLKGLGKTTFIDLPTDIAREQCLRIATNYMTNTYRLLWQGYRYTVTQALDWPRIEVFIKDSASAYIGPQPIDFRIVPQPVINACIDFAELIASGEDLAPDLDPVTSKEKIDVIEITFDPNSAPYKIWRMAAMQLAPYLGDGPGAGMFRRVVRT